ncbi:hypothetical protein AALA56_06220, partial [Streptococcus hyointestinalis]|uniref:hypothetical protein n=1 Tax=Streptococcus hyointestinalis TaxID=1337 RepID=UPI0035180583
PSLEVAFFDVVEILHIVVSVNRYIVPKNIINNKKNVLDNFIVTDYNQFIKSRNNVFILAKKGKKI